MVPPQTSARKTSTPRHLNYSRPVSITVPTVYDTCEPQRCLFATYLVPLMSSHVCRTGFPLPSTVRPLPCLYEPQHSPGFTGAFCPNHSPTTPSTCQHSPCLRLASTTRPVCTREAHPSRSQPFVLCLNRLRPTSTAVLLSPRVRTSPELLSCLNHVSALVHRLECLLDNSPIILTV